MPGERFLDQERFHFLEAHLLEAQGAVRNGREAEIVCLDLCSLRHEHGAFDDMIEFAHVARKLMTRERFVGGWFEAGELFPVALSVLPQKVRGERRDVFAPLAQWWQGDLDRVQAKEQILPEASGGDFLVQI